MPEHHTRIDIATDPRDNIVPRPNRPYRPPNACAREICLTCRTRATTIGRCAESSDDSTRRIQLEHWPRNDRVALRDRSCGAQEMIAPRPGLAGEVPSVLCDRISGAIKPGDAAGLNHGHARFGPNEKESTA